MARIFFGVVTILLFVSTLQAAPVAVRFPEGSLHGFLAVRALDGGILGYGEQLQGFRDGTIETHLLLRFDDGSIHDETVVFTQQKVFTMRSYRLVQQGPSFPKPMDASLDRASQQYKVKYRDGDKTEKMAGGRLELPPDLYNGMQSIILKNLAKGASETVQLVAFTPEPKIVGAKLSAGGSDSFYLGKIEKKAIDYLLKPQLGVLGVLASVIGKKPPDYHYWILDGEAPAFLAFEGPLYVDGPIWRVELTSPRRPKDKG
jgi:hypothetical protein